MANFIVQEIQVDANGTAALLPPEVRTSLAEASSLFYQKCGYAVVSSVPVHTIVTYTDEGLVVQGLRATFKHSQK